MRSQRTPHEDCAIAAVKALLDEQGHDVIEIPDITDKPDAALVVDGKTVALECRAYTPERLLRLHGLMKLPPAVHQVYVPLEPHLWIQRAVQDKAPKVEEYLERSGASVAWLVVHSAGLFNFASLYNEGFDWVFKLGACSIDHGFQRIYLTGDHQLAAVCLFSEHDDLEQRRALRGKRVTGVPVDLRRFGWDTATAAPNGEGQIVIDFKQAAPPLMLQPLDRALRVDYSVLDGRTAAEIILDPALAYLYTVEPPGGALP